MASVVNRKHKSGEVSHKVQWLPASIAIEITAPPPPGLV